MSQLDLLFETCTVEKLPLAHTEIYYYPRFIDCDYFSELLAQIEWQQDRLPMYGKEVLIPRLNAWYGDKDAAYGYSGLRLARHDWLPILLSLKEKIEHHSHFHFNSVLANYYRDGHDSVSWHSDDEPELGINPVIASLSFGDSRRFSLREKSGKRQAPYHIELEPGSLLIMAGETQHYWQHQIAKTETRGDRGRINLTFRNIRGK